MYNLLSFPAGVLPVTKVKENEQFYDDGRGDEFTHYMNETMKDSKGLPVGI